MIFKSGNGGGGGRRHTGHKEELEGKEKIGMYVGKIKCYRDEG